MDPKHSKPSGPHAAIRRRTKVAGAHNAVLRGIGFAIVSGEFPGGSPLPAKEVLMRRYGVSNTPLREALQSLASKGLIAARTKVGTWVRDEADWNMFDPDILAWRLEVGIDKAFLAKLFEIRQTLEPAAAAIAAGRRTESQIAELRALIEAMATASADRLAFTEVDVAFHLLVLSASGNPFMQSIGALIRTALAASFTSSSPTDDPERAVGAVAQHGRIAEAIAAGDAQEAAEAMMTVIRQGWTNNGGRFEQLAHLALEHFAIPPPQAASRRDRRSPARPDEMERPAGEVASTQPTSG